MTQFSDTSLYKTSHFGVANKPINNDTSWCVEWRNESTTVHELSPGSIYGCCLVARVFIGTTESAVAHYRVSWLKQINMYAGWLVELFIHSLADYLGVGSGKTQWRTQDFFKGGVSELGGIIYVTPQSSRAT